MSIFEKMLYDGTFDEEFNDDCKFDDSGFEFSLDANFPHMNEKSLKIKHILEEYTFESLEAAIFAINAWKSNRSSQESCLSLNKTFVSLENEGKKEINTYEDFCVFFSLIEPFLQITVSDDHVLNDFGEVKISYQNKFYPVITGTGHSGCVFSALNFLEELSKSLMKQNETLNILEFTSTMITALSKYNLKNDNNTHIGFEVPSADFYRVVVEYMKSKPINTLSQSIINMLSRNDLPIVETHFCKKNDHVFLLFNPSLLLDYQSNLIRNINDETLSKIVKKSMINKINSIYVSKNIDSREFVSDKFLLCENQKPIKIEYDGFILSLNKRVILFIEEDSVESKTEFTKIIKTLLKDNLLNIVNLNKEVADRRFEGFQVTNEMPVDILFFNNYIDISQTFGTFGSRDDILSYIAVDLMFMLLFASDIDEIIEFIYSKESESTQIIWHC